jgi:flagellar biogenesis protein FliO
MVTETRQQSPARQMFGYFGVIAMILIVVAALCWGFAHI